MSASRTSRRARLAAFLREEHAAHPWMLPGIALTGSAAIGTHTGWLFELVAGLAR